MLQRCQKPKTKNMLCASADFFFYRAQSIRNAAETYNIFLRIFWLCQNMENDVNSKEMLYNKISENPRKGFFTIAGSGDEQDQKMNVFSKLYITRAFLLSVRELYV